MELPTTELQQERLYVARDDWHALGAIYLGLRKGDVVKVTRKLPQGEIACSEISLEHLLIISRLVAWSTVVKHKRGIHAL